MKSFITNKFKNNFFLLHIVSVVYTMLYSCGIVKLWLGKHNKIILNGAFLKNVSFEIKGSGNVFVFNEKTRIKNVRISVKGHNHVLYISSDCHIHGGSFWFEDSNCIIYIGEKTTIESAHFAVAEPNRKIIIGKDCMLSHDVEFRTSDSHSILDLNGNRINCAKDIIVYDHVWIGARATVLKGVTISKNVIIGNGSIVTRSVLEENCVSTGVPNCIIKRHVKWIRERIYK